MNATDEEHSLGTGAFLEQHAIHVAMLYGIDETHNCVALKPKELCRVACHMRTMFRSVQVLFKTSMRYSFEECPHWSIIGDVLLFASCKIRGWRQPLSLVSVLSPESFNIILLVYFQL